MSFADEDEFDLDDDDLALRALIEQLLKPELQRTIVSTVKSEAADALAKSDVPSIQEVWHGNDVKAKNKLQQRIEAAILERKAEIQTMALNAAEKHVQNHSSYVGIVTGEVEMDPTVRRILKDNHAIVVVERAVTSEVRQIANEEVANLVL